MIHVLHNIYNDDSISVKVVELGDIEGLGQPGVVCVTEENNLSSMKTSLLYRECVIVERWKYESLLRTLEAYQKPQPELPKPQLIPRDVIEKFCVGTMERGPVHPPKETP